jgi:hypothetical protein
LLGGQVFPLDGLPESEGKINQFEAYRSYAGIAESTFFSDVKAAVGRPSPSGDGQ